MRDRIKGEGWGASPVNRVKRQELKEFRFCPAFLVGLEIQCLHQMLFWMNCPCLIVYKLNLWCLGPRKKNEISRETLPTP
eukprot:scaffold272302_cov37-Tisochrysis_lutea.AAC.1